MSFRVWLEGIEGSAEIVHRIQQAVESAPDYESAAKALAEMGAKKPWSSTYFATDWANSIYGLMASPHEKKEDPKIDAEIDRQRDRIKELPGLRLHPVDVNNAWYYFSVEGDKGMGSKVKLHAKAPVEDLDMLFRVAKVVVDNADYFSAFKFSPSSGSMTSRRDNLVMYLSKWGQNNLDKVKELLGAVGTHADVGEDVTVDNMYSGGEDVSHTQRMSYRLAAMLASKPGAPINKKFGIWKTEGQALAKVDPVVAHYTRLAMGGESGPSGGPLVIGAMSGGARPLTFNIPANVGRGVLGMTLRGDDSLRYWSDSQFSVEKGGDGWHIVPSSGAVNATTVNGSVLTGRKKLAVGDSISIHSKTGKRVTPLKVLSA